ncbi:MAG TPA: dephospho-CoA kinase [Longimicrobiaceae bacterium]
MLKVGLTGNIASGKSTVARAWRDLGARVIDADELARRAVAPGSPGLASIVSRWGEDVLDAGGSLDRAAMRERVFGDPAARVALEAIIHPRVAELRDEELQRAAEAGEEVVVADIPLLFEVGLQSEFDLVVLVDAPVDVRLERIVRDRGLEPAEAARMIASQMPSEQKRPLADIVIDNTGTIEDLRGAARDAWDEISRRAREPA